MFLILLIVSNIIILIICIITYLYHILHALSVKDFMFNTFLLDCKNIKKITAHQTIINKLIERKSVNTITITYVSTYVST